MKEPEHLRAFWPRSLDLDRVYGVNPPINPSIKTLSVQSEGTKHSFILAHMTFPARFLDLIAAVLRGQFWLFMAVCNLGDDFSFTSHCKTVLLCLSLKVGGLLTLIASLAGSQPPIWNPGTGVRMIKYWKFMKKEKVEWHDLLK